MKEGVLKIAGDMTAEERSGLKREFNREYEGENADKILEARKLELQKTREELEMIERLNVWMRNYFEDLGVEDVFSGIDPDRIIILSDQDFINVGRDLFGSDWSFYAGKMIPYQNILFIRKLPEEHKFSTLMSLVHESLHVDSHLSIKIFKGNEDTDLDNLRANMRTGYSIQSLKKRSADENYKDGSGDDKMDVFEYFDGLNEAIVQMISLDILDRNFKEIEANFGVSRDDQKEFKYKDGYAGYRHIIMVMMKRMADKNGVSMRGYWSEFRKNLFSGNLMFLREVERVFGKGSLRVLAFMGSDSSHARDMDLIKLLEEYFMTEDNDNRNKIAEKIFDKEGDERYFEKYKKRRD